MFGKYKVKIYSKRISYEFEVRRKYTILKGFSAEGKSELCRLVSEKGGNVDCQVKISVLRSDIDYEALLGATSNTIYLVDESFDNIGTKEFASIMKHSDNYFVLITRRSLKNVPYSINEIYTLKSEKLESNSDKIKNVFKNRFDISNKLDFNPDILISEDSKSGFLNDPPKMVHRSTLKV